MSIVADTSTVASFEEARDLTHRIRRCLDRAWQLLLEAHERRAWVALAYTTWEKYVRTEFNLTRQHSYRLLDQEKVILEIEKAAGVSPVGDIVTERVARDLKPVLEEVNLRDRRGGYR